MTLRQPKKETSGQRPRDRARLFRSWPTSQIPRRAGRFGLDARLAGLEDVERLLVDAHELVQDRRELEAGLEVEDRRQQARLDGGEGPLGVLRVRAERDGERGLGSKRVIQRCFNVGVPRASVRETTVMPRDRSER